MDFGDEQPMVIAEPTNTVPVVSMPLAAQPGNAPVPAKEYGSSLGEHNLQGPIVETSGRMASEFDDGEVIMTTELNLDELESVESTPLSATTIVRRSLGEATLGTEWSSSQGARANAGMHSPHSKEYSNSGMGRTMRQRASPQLETIPSIGEPQPPDVAVTVLSKPEGFSPTRLSYMSTSAPVSTGSQADKRSDINNGAQDRSLKQFPAISDPPNVSQGTSRLQTDGFETQPSSVNDLMSTWPVHSQSRKAMTELDELFDLGNFNLLDAPMMPLQPTLNVATDTGDPFADLEPLEVQNAAVSTESEGVEQVIPSLSSMNPPSDRSVSSMFPHNTGQQRAAEYRRQEQETVEPPLDLFQSTHLSSPCYHVPSTPSSQGFELQPLQMRSGMTAMEHRRDASARNAGSAEVSRLMHATHARPEEALHPSRSKKLEKMFLDELDSLTKRGERIGVRSSR